MPAAQFERSPRADRSGPADRPGPADGADGSCGCEPSGSPDRSTEPSRRGRSDQPGRLEDTDPQAGQGWTGIDLLARLGGFSGRRARRAGERTRWSRRALALVVVVVAVLASAVELRGYLPVNPRVLVYGDSLVVEAQEPFRQAARDEGAHAVDLRIWSGTAPCNWVGDVPGAIRDFRPTVAVIAFSGNRPACMDGRGDLMAAYREDVTTMVDQLVSAGVQVRLIEEPARETDPVDAAGRTRLGELWETIAAATPNTRVVRADLSVTDGGRFVPTLPCDPGEPCGPDGRVVVRAPDGVHFCPHPPEVVGSCGMYSSGARRYGLALARAALG
jgi:hypothetical protein